MEKLQCFYVIFARPDFAPLPEMQADVQSATQCLDLGDRLFPQAKVALRWHFVREDKAVLLVVVWSLVKVPPINCSPASIHYVRQEDDLLTEPYTVEYAES